ncbi:MAG TPA: hypothetical protein V6D30_10735 [Leptolyngbyaceae cyanobacterium]
MSNGFYIRSGGSETDSIEKAVLTKSPIDALSKAVLDQPHKRRTLYLAADSARSLPLNFLLNMPTVVAAYDNDKRCSLGASRKFGGDRIVSVP